MASLYFLLLALLASFIANGTGMGEIGWKSQQACSNYFNQRKKLYGGDPNNCEGTTGELPHLAHWGGYLDFESQKTCVASLISDRYLLTYASCKYGKQPWIAKLGNGKRVEIEDIRVHPDYTIPRSYNDIALLRLKNSVKFTKRIFPACLETWDTIKEKEAIASRWGKNSKFGKYLSKVTLPLLNIFDCKKIYKPNKMDLLHGVAVSSMLCAGRKNQKEDNCEGKSGGPLQIEKPGCLYYIIGIQLKHDCVTLPGLYTKVSSFIEWIEEVVWKDV